MKNENKEFGKEEPKALPESFEGGEEKIIFEEDKHSHKGGTRFFPFKAGAVFVAVSACEAIAIILIFAVLFSIKTTPISVPEQSETDMPAETVPIEEWRGVFESKEIYKKVLGSMVVIETEGGKSVQAGFVYSSDGYIAAVLGDGIISADGRVYVRDSLDRKYKVESIVRDGDSGTALLKIEADGLVPIDFFGGDNELLPGEELIAIGCHDTSEMFIRTGEASGYREAMLDVNISLDSSMAGTPLFDREGKLVAVALNRENQGYGGIYQTIFSSKLKNRLEKLKNDNY